MEVAYLADSQWSAFEESHKNYRKHWIQTKENIRKNVKEYPSIKSKIDSFAPVTFLYEYSHFFRFL